MPASNPVTETSCHTKVCRKQCSIVWTIDDYKTVQEKRGITINPSPFSSINDEFKWILYLNPKSSNRNGHGCISLYLSPKQTADIAKFGPISGMAKCCILNVDKVETKSQSKEFHLASTQSNVANYNNIMFDYFVDHTFLHNQDNRLLPDDKLTIFCEVSYIKKTDIVNMEGPISVLQDENASVGLDGLSTLFLNPEFSDITLNVKGKDYPAHKSILAARSPVFKAMLINDMKEKHTNRIEIKDMTESAFTEMLRYIYTGWPENLELLVSELLAAADKYNLENLKKICEEELHAYLTPETAVNTLMLAHIHHADTLKTQALQYIKIHSYNSQILDNKTRKMLVETCPNLLLEILDAFGKQVAV